MTTTETDPIALTIADGVAEILLNRPARRNAMNLALQEGLTAAIETVRESPARALVIGGVGRHFCVGADLDVVDGEDRAGGDDTTARMLAACERFLLALRTLPMPIVVAVEGAAAGGGSVKSEASSAWSLAALSTWRSRALCRSFCALSSSSLLIVVSVRGGGTSCTAG